MLKEKKKLKLKRESSNLNIESITKEEIELLKSEIANLKNIFASKSNDIEAFRLKAVEIAKYLEKCKKTLNEKQLIEVKNSVKALIANAEKSKKHIDYNKQDLNLPKPKIAQNQKTNIITIQNLRSKKSELLNSFNNLELEEDFRRTCLAYENDSNAHDTPILQAYQDYVNTYCQKAFLFNVHQIDNNANLLIYNTETETQVSKILQTPQPLNYGICTAQLPNGKLFCFGKDYPPSGITLLIDENWRVEELPSGTSCYWSSAIYFNNNIYCFGGCDNFALALSSRFDLGGNQWNELTPLPMADYWCNSIIFNGRILISGFLYKNILQYSIDNNYFDIIPYEFTAYKRKILIKAERLYLIECENGPIYESEIGSEVTWRQITNNSTITFHPIQLYFQYNKGGIYIGSIYYNEDHRHTCLKFNLNEKRLTKLFDNKL